MRKLFVALLAVGLVFAFTAPAFATDASFSGYYRLRGFWFNNEACADDSMHEDLSRNRAYYDNRLRVQMVLNVAEGLSVTGRFHAMDRVWGQYETLNVSTSTQNWQKDNIYWHRAYMTFKTAIGKFDAGYQSGGTWGTIFGDTEADGRARIKYTGVFGPVIGLALTEKFKEVDGLTTNGNQDEDMDWDAYAVAGIYKWDGGQAGLLFYYLINKTDDSYVDTRWVPVPYFKANFGPLYLEGEYLYYGGTVDYDDPATQDKDRKGNAWYLYGKFNLGPAYVGAQYAFREGDDPTTNDLEEGYPGSDYNPCVLLWNDNTSGLGYTSNTTSTGIANGSLFQIFGGFSPMESLTLEASVTYAWADYCAAGVDDEIGTEIDLQATYKIFDNLEYWIGFGYLVAGDWFQAGNTANKIDDAWLIMHKLQMNF
ncbi:MAG: hypothetical protein JW736_04320 [Deltaproteobacteria bacterium]|nr:hypothetical protein [Deltaproteobacteria bacterium]MBN2686893.1 hypothetical protein [Deltaproteobacteria bacterium]